MTGKYKDRFSKYDSRSAFNIRDARAGTILPEAGGQFWKKIWTTGALETTEGKAEPLIDAQRR
jgi:hypothetical protein